MSSLIAWLARMGLSIYVQGPPTPSPHSDLVSGDRDRLILLADRGIALVGEESNDTALLPVQVRVGKCWEDDGKVCEITGFDTESAEYLEWPTP